VKELPAAIKLYTAKTVLAA